MKRVLGTALASVALFGTPALAVDDREAVMLSAEQRDFVLGEMRLFLETVQDIILATAEGDMAAVKESASAMGLAHARETNQSGRGPGKAAPMAFRQMGRGTHMAFDELAQASEFGSDGVLEELGVLMSNCNGCHASYKLVLKP